MALIAQGTADATVRRSPLLGATLLLTMAAQALTFALLPAVLPAMAVYFGEGRQGELTAQLAAVFPFLGLTIGALGSGWLIRRVGLRAAIVLAALAYATGGALGMLAGERLLLLGGCTLVGLGAAVLTSGLAAVTATSYDGSARARIVGFQSAIANLLAATLGLGSAFAADRLGWRAPFGVYAGFGLLMLLLVALSVQPSGPAERNGASANRSALIAWPIFLAGGTAFMLATTQSTQLPFLLAQNGIASPGLRSVVTTLTSGFAFLASLSFGGLHARAGERSMILIGAVTGTVGWLLFGGWSHGLPIACLAAAFLGIGLGILVPLLYAAVMRAVPGEASGQAVGLLNTSIFLGSFANPALATPLRALAGLSGMMFVLAAMTLAIGVVALTRSARRVSGAARTAYRAELHQSLFARWSGR